jgi:hypothetical protein
MILRSASSQSTAAFEILERSYSKSVESFGIQIGWRIKWRMCSLGLVTDKQNGGVLI